MDPLTAALTLGQFGLGFFGPDPARRRQNDQINNLNFLDQLRELMQGLGLSVFDPGREGLLEQGVAPLNGPQQEAFGALMGTGFNAGGFLGQTPDLFRESLGFVDPRSLGPDVFDSAQMDVQNRGNTAQLTAVEDRLNEFRDANRAALGPVLQSASGIIQSGGRTPESIAAAQEFMDVIGARGQTPELRRAFGLGTDLVESGGFTPGLRDLQRTFESQLSAGGLTPEARRALEPLIQIIESGGAGGAVLSDDVAASFARDAAATASAQAAEGVRRQAIQRGSAPGVVAGSGLQNQTLAEFGDAAAQNEARALREAILGQQQARLQQMGIATGGAGQILSDATRLLASANAGLGSIASASAANLASGAGLISDSQRIAAQNFATGTAGFNQNFANEIARLGTGGDIFNQGISNFNQSELGSAQGLMDVEAARRAQQNAAAAQLLGLSGQALDARGQNIGAFGDFFQNMLSGFNAQTNAFGTGANLATGGRGQQLGAQTSLLNTGRDLLLSIPGDIARNRTTTLTGIDPGPTNLRNILTGGMKGASGNVSNILGGILRGFGGGGNPGNGAIGG